MCITRFLSSKKIGGSLLLIGTLIFGVLTASDCWARMCSISHKGGQGCEDAVSVKNTKKSCVNACQAAGFKTNASTAATREKNGNYKCVQCTDGDVKSDDKGNACSYDYYKCCGPYADINQAFIDGKVLMETDKNSCKSDTYIDKDCKNSVKQYKPITSGLCGVCEEDKCTGDVISNTATHGTLTEHVTSGNIELVKTTVGNMAGCYKPCASDKYTAYYTGTPGNCNETSEGCCTKKLERVTSLPCEEGYEWVGHDGVGTVTGKGGLSTCTCVAMQCSRGVTSTGDCKSSGNLSDPQDSTCCTYEQIDGVYDTTGGDKKPCYELSYKDCPDLVGEGKVNERDTGWHKYSNTDCRCIPNTCEYVLGEGWQQEGTLNACQYIASAETKQIHSGTTPIKCVKIGTHSCPEGLTPVASESDKTCSCQCADRTYPSKKDAKDHFSGGCPSDDTFVEIPYNSEFTGVKKVVNGELLEDNNAPTKCYEATQLDCGTYSISSECVSEYTNSGYYLPISDVPIEALAPQCTCATDCANLSDGHSSLQIRYGDYPYSLTDSESGGNSNDNYVKYTISFNDGQQDKYCYRAFTCPKDTVLKDGKCECAITEAAASEACKGDTHPATTTINNVDRCDGSQYLTCYHTNDSGEIVCGNDDCSKFGIGEQEGDASSCGCGQDWKKEGTLTVNGVTIQCGHCVNKADQTCPEGTYAKQETNKEINADYYVCSMESAGECQAWKNGSEVPCYKAKTEWHSNDADACPGESGYSCSNTKQYNYDSTEGHCRLKCQYCIPTTNNQTNECPSNVDEAACTELAASMNVECTFSFDFSGHPAALIGDYIAGCAVSNKPTFGICVCGTRRYCKYETGKSPTECGF